MASSLRQRWWAVGILAATMVLALSPGDAGAHWRLIGRNRWGTYPYGYCGLYGGCGWAGCYSCCNYGSWASCCSPGYGYPGYSYPRQYPGARPAPGIGSRPVPSEAVVMHVHVPSQAKVEVNGRATQASGSERWFISRNAKAGTYRYVVRIEMMVDGKIVTDEKVITAKTGEEVELAFDPNATPESGQVAAQPDDPDAPLTMLAVNVPKDAKVYLAGNLTSTPGTHRVYATRQLPAGTRYDAYEVRVEIERGGETLVERRTIDLAAGQTRTLDFNVDSLAQRPIR